jgi:hypothetical protein
MRQKNGILRDFILLWIRLNIGVEIIARWEDPSWNME